MTGYPILGRSGLHTSAFYAALFMATGVMMPFWPLWLADWGLTPEEVGLYTALGIAVRVVAGLGIPAVADRLDARRHTVVVCAVATALLFLWHLGITHKATLLVATLAVGVSMAGITPIAEALGVAAARAWQFPYAQARGIGSIGFLLSNLLVGALIGWTGSWIALWWIVACMVGLTLLAFHHPGAGRVRGQVPPSMAEIRTLVTNPVFAIFMGGVAFTQASHAVMYAYGSIHWRDLGISEATIGALWAASVGAEILFMLTIGTAVVSRFGAVGCMALSGVGGIVRWGVMMTDPTGYWLWPIQGLHTVTFALGHLGAIAFISRAVPERYAAAAQGATGAMAVGGVMALGMALAALLYPSLGGRTYGLGVVSSSLGLVFCLWLARRWQGADMAV